MTTSQPPIRTLIVDDEALSRRGLEIRLRAAGDFAVIGQCANGREAIDAVRNQQPDLVFLDIQMPGLDGFGVLRAVAREAGVSHAAPTHHFGDLTGLLSELAAIGYRQFSAAMIAANASGTREQKGLASAKAYVAFAQAHPGLYGLMFRTERLDMSRPSLHEASGAAFAGLARGVGASRNEHIEAEGFSLEQGGAIVRAWSMVHGFTMLLLDDRLSDIMRRLPKGTTIDQLFEAMLKSPTPRRPVP